MSLTHAEHTLPLHSPAVLNTAGFLCLHSRPSAYTSSQIRMYPHPTINTLTHSIHTRFSLSILILVSQGLNPAVYEDSKPIMLHFTLHHKAFPDRHFSFSSITVFPNREDAIIIRVGKKKRRLAVGDPSPL